MMLGGCVYFSPANLCVKTVSNTIPKSFKAGKIALGKKIWPQGLEIFNLAALSTSFSAVLFHCLFANRIQSFLLEIILFHMNLELLKAQAFLY